MANMQHAKQVGKCVGDTMTIRKVSLQFKTLYIEQ